MTMLGGKQLQLDAKDFENKVMTLLSLSKRKIKKIEIQNRRILEEADNHYEIDVFVVFEFMDVEFKVLVECKHHKNPIKREVVQVLNDRIRELGCHKGMIFSTANYQSGAIAYALKHGIALITLADGKSAYRTRSLFETSDLLYNGGKFKCNGWMYGHSEDAIYSISKISGDSTEYLDQFLST